MTQAECVERVMELNGGYSTYEQLYSDVFNISGNNFRLDSYQTNIRSIVQRDRRFFKIKPGLWALESYRDRLPQDIKDMIEEPIESYFDRPTEHARIQADLLNMGRKLGFEGYIYSQDKKRTYEDGKRLQDIVDMIKMPKFTYSSIIDKLKTIDVIWFETISETEFKFPKVVFEVESTTNIKNSLNKFKWLIPFNMQYMYIIAPKSRELAFEEIIKEREYSDIRNRVKFLQYEDIEYFVEHPNKLFKFGLI